MFTTAFKEKCIEDLKRLIEIPEKGFFKVNASGPEFFNARIDYRLDGTLKHLPISDLEELAAMAEKHGLIFMASYDDAKVVMYRKSLSDVVNGVGGKLVWKPKLVKVGWQDIRISIQDAIDIVSLHEYELAGKLMGMAAAKVISIFKRNHPQAA